MKLHSTTTAGQLIEARRNVQHLTDTLAAWEARADEWDPARIEVVRQGLADAVATRDAIAEKLASEWLASIIAEENLLRMARQHYRHSHPAATTAATRGEWCGECVPDGLVAGPSPTRCECNAGNIPS